VEEPEQYAGGARVRIRTIPVDTSFLDEVDKWVGMTTKSERDSFRASLETQIFTFQREQRAKAAANGGVASGISDTVVWNTIPKLGDGIRAMLNNETKKRLERMLKSPLELHDETDEDRRQRAAMFERFNTLGYCQHCRDQAIEYFTINKLWAIQG
jgi:predicted Ser/Thr protein kinase